MRKRIKYLLRVNSLITLGIREKLLHPKFYKNIGWLDLFDNCIDSAYKEVYGDWDI